MRRQRDGGVKAIPDQSESTHSHGLQICVPANSSCYNRALFLLSQEKGSIPAGDLKGRAKNLGTYEFGHFGSRASVTPAQ
jgi:hypothetical protein